ncbi:hypothetical protein FQN54_006403 [Arachnomyces sp. PD_36]|nr:hypothetical protein FQN54_006403 [Arachnomyces sp. PD_36]
MAAPTSSAQSHTQKPAVPSAPKLRDSCHACSASKVKCSRQKPSCARCAKRGLPCEYLATRRAGRKHDGRKASGNINQTSNTAATHANQGVSGPGNIAATPTSSSVTGNLTPTSAHMRPSLSRQHSSGYQDTVLPDFFSTVEPNFSADFNDWIGSPISFPGHETSDAEGSAQHFVFSEELNNDLSDAHLAAAFLRPEDAFSIMEETTSEPQVLSRPCSPIHSQASTAITSAQLHESSNGCLVHALGLLKQLFPNASTGCARSKTPEDPAETTRHLPTIQSAVLENAQTIDAISNMLQCPCSQDDYLLMVMSLIVFKVLGWYAAAARGTPTAGADDIPSSQTNSLPHWGESKSSRHIERVLQIPAVVGGYCIDGEDQARMAGQLVLSELHRAQRLVNQLSDRLKNRSIRNGPTLSASDNIVHNPEAHSDSGNPSPFSTTLLDQLENDVRKRLRSLSSEIVSMLRHG